MTPRLLDLFCGAGGASAGYAAAGFDVTGVDIAPSPRYPWPTIRADALALEPEFLQRFDAIHASPPCQRWSSATGPDRARNYPDLIAPVRNLLSRAARPWVIENVERAPLRAPAVLCGTAFPGLRVIRHRAFETNFPLDAPPCRPHPRVHTHDRRRRQYGATSEFRDYVQVTGGGNCSLAAARDAMGGCEWMTKSEINQAVPPAYTRFVGRALLREIETRRLRPQRRACRNRP